jgi:two-component system, NtrC family, sensor kinase
MHVTLLDTPESIRTELGRELEARGLSLELRHDTWARPTLPQVLPPGLVVFWDAGGSLEALLGTCRQLASVCGLSRTCLVVLTRRARAEHGVLLEAGVSECLTPVPRAGAEHWTPGLLPLIERLLASQPSPSQLPPGGSRVPPDRALQTLLAATTADLGHDFFRTLVKQLAEAFRVTCAMVGEMNPEQESIHTMAFWSGGDFQENLTYPLQGTPCYTAVANSICHYADDVSRYFPEDLMLTDFGLRGYLGAALKSARGEVIGVLAILHDQVLDAGELDFAVLGAFAARAGAELERIRAHAELERTRDFLRNTLDAVPDPLFVKDRAHGWVAVNSAFCDLVGVPEERLLGHRPVRFLPEPESRLYQEQDEQSLASGEPSESELSFTDATGLPRTVITKRAVFPGADGQPALVSVIRDVTERKRMETQLRLADRMASMGTLAAGVAHEINNPLAYVCANIAYLSEQLAEETLAPGSLIELREVMAETQSGIDRVRAIVQDLKDFARGDEELRGPIDVHHVIESALRLVRNELQRHNARLEQTLQPVPTVLGNGSRLGQVLVNLLVNALQAFPEKRPEHNRIRIATRLEEESDRVVVEVEDNGVGMTQEVLQRIFDPFFTTKPVGVGTGLGLSICHTIVESMGGTIDVRSTPGRGTLFLLSLPIFVEDEEKQADKADGKASARSAPPLEQLRDAHVRALGR